MTEKKVTPKELTEAGRRRRARMKRLGVKDYRELFKRSDGSLIPERR